MMTLKQRTANPFGTHRLWLSRCLTHNTLTSVTKHDLQTRHDSNNHHSNNDVKKSRQSSSNVHLDHQYEQLVTYSTLSSAGTAQKLHDTYTRTGRMTAFMLPYEARQMRSRKTVSATFAGLSSSLGLSGSLRKLLVNRNTNQEFSCTRNTGRVKISAQQASMIFNKITINKLNAYNKLI